MEKRYIIRILTWGLTFFILAGLGIYGLILSSNNSPSPTENTNKLENIVNYFNSNNYKDSNIISSKQNNKIIISYTSSTENKDYEYQYSNNILTTSFDTNDETGMGILKIMLASVAENLGKSYTDIITKFDTLDLTTYSIGEGIYFEDNGSLVNVQINTNVDLVIKEAEYFTQSDLNINEITEGSFNTTKDSLKLNINGTENPIITISESPIISTNSYNSILSVISILFNDTTTSNYFENNYSSINIGNKTFNGFKIEINPNLNDNEKLIFNSNEQIIRVTINKDQLSI